MKPYYLLCLAVVLTTFPSFSQSKKELQATIYQLTIQQIELNRQINDLKSQINSLNQEISRLNAENSRLISQVNNPSPASTSNGVSTPVKLEGGGRCQAVTQAGKQCSRSADAGSNYCWQHKSTYEPNKQNATSTSSSSSTSSGRTIYTGPRGGKYYINSKGNKVYVKQ